MKLLRRIELVRASHPDRRGAALMLALLVLFVLVAVVFQIKVGTDTHSRADRNTRRVMSIDNAIESAMLQVFEDLKADGEATNDSGGAGDPGQGAGLADLSGLANNGGIPGADGGGESTDSREDEWARAQRSEINEVRLRIVIQDENSKYNVLAMLTEDEGEAEKALDRVTRILDWCRHDTEWDIDYGDAQEMAEQMLDHMQRRRDSLLPDPDLLTDDEEQEELGLPLSLREFVVLPSFEEHHFRDFRDEEENVVHSIGSFLTIWTELTTHQEQDPNAGSGGNTGGDPGNPGSPGSSGPSVLSAPGSGANIGAQGLSQDSSSGSDGDGSGGSSGVAVNINTAPRAVLQGMFDDRDVPYRFWDELIEYRNLEEEEETLADDNDEDPPLDEYGQEIVPRQIFDDVGELNELYTWSNLEPVVQGEMRNLATVSSTVFTIMITGRVMTGANAQEYYGMSPQELRRAEENADSIARSVRCVVWRRQNDDGDVELVPLERWEVLDYVPYEVLDFPPEDR